MATITRSNSLKALAEGGCGYLSPKSILIGITLGHSSGAEQMPSRSEEHTPELQPRRDLVCRLLLEKKKLVPGIPRAPHRRHASARGGACWSALSSTWAAR